MKGHNKKMELLGSAPIPKALLAMGMPILLEAWERAKWVRFQ